MKSCRNCDTALLYHADFCHACGQKYTDGKHPIWAVLTEFIDAIFSLEARSIKTVAGLFFPGHLTKEYFSGKQAQYMHPTRIFLFAAGIFLAVFGYQANKKTLAKANNASDTIHEFIVKQAVVQEIDSVYTNFKCTGILGSDTSKIDSLITQIKETVFSPTDSIGKLNSSFFQLNGTMKESLKQYHKQEDYWSHIVLSQMIRMTKDPSSFFRQILGSMIWMILSLMPAVALVLKLIYIRREKFFVEHLLFSFHFHAFAFLSLAIVLGFFPHSLALFGVVLGAILIYLFIAIKQFYGQSFLKSLLKWWLLLVGYTFIFLFYFVIWLLMSLITF